MPENIPFVGEQPNILTATEINNRRDEVTLDPQILEMLYDWIQSAREQNVPLYYSWDQFHRTYGATQTTRQLQRYWDRAIDMPSRQSATNKKSSEVPKKDIAFLDSTFIKEFGRGRFTSVTGEIGIEIEVEGRNLFSSPVSYWNAISDGSLRDVDGHRPLEYVLRQPIRREEVGKALNYLVSRLRSHGSELVMSHRCSVHVHVNVQKMTMKNLINMMCLYFLFEDILVEWSGPDRKGNLFCLRAKDADYQIELLYDAIKKAEWSNLFEQDYRYAAMNMSSLGNHGSLEFRSMKGNADTDIISQWVSILLALKDAAEGFENPGTISRMYNSMGARSFLIKVFEGRAPSSVIETFLSYPIEQWMLESFQTAKDIFHCIDWNNPPKYMQGEVVQKTKVLSRAHGIDEPEVEED